MKRVNKAMDSLDEYVFGVFKKDENTNFGEVSDTHAREIVKQYCPSITDDTKLVDFKKTLEEAFFSLKVDYTMFNARQLGLKVSANSIYGFTGAQACGKYSLIECSMSVTSRGRELITDSALFFKKHYGATTVYGDTDSTMVYVPEIDNDPKKVWEMADVMERKINGTKDKFDEKGKLIEKGEKGIFPTPLYLEFEKAMRALFMKKKHYAYMEYDKNGEIIKEKNSEVEALNVKGIVLARRDNCKWIRDTYETMVRGIFAENTIEVSFDMIVDAVVDVIDMAVSHIIDLERLGIRSMMIEHNGKYNICYINPEKITPVDNHKNNLDTVRKILREQTSDDYIFDEYSLTELINIQIFDRVPYTEKDDSNIPSPDILENRGINMYNISGDILNLRTEKFPKFNRDKVNLSLDFSIDLIEKIDTYYTPVIKIEDTKIIINKDFYIPTDSEKARKGFAKMFEKGYFLTDFGLERYINTGEISKKDIKIPEWFKSQDEEEFKNLLNFISLIL